MQLFGQSIWRNYKKKKNAHKSEIVYFSHTVNNIKIEYNNLGFASDPLSQYCSIHT